MRTPTARKLPSGSWFCRVRVGGKDVSITKPTEAEAIAEAVAVKLGLTDAAQAAKHEAHDITLEQAISNYISARQNVASACNSFKTLLTSSRSAAPSSFNGNKK